MANRTLRGDARRWFTAPKPQPGGRIPLEVIRTTEGCQEVLRALPRIEHGAFSWGPLTGFRDDWPRRSRA